MLKDFTSDGVRWWGPYHATISAVALAIISGFIPRTSGDCTTLSVAYAVVYFLGFIAAAPLLRSSMWGNINETVSPALTLSAVIIALVGDGSDTAEKIIGAMAMSVSVVSAVGWVVNKRAKNANAPAVSAPADTEEMSAVPSLLGSLLLAGNPASDVRHMKPRKDVQPSAAKLTIHDVEL